MTLVVDASVVGKWFFHEPLHEEATRLLDYKEQFNAPELIMAEVANLAWKRCRRGEIEPDHARTIVSSIRFYLPRLHPLAALSDRALDIALVLGHPVYDCFYLACAETVGGVLITADKRLYAAAEVSELADYVVRLGDRDRF